MINLLSADGTPPVNTSSDHYDNTITIIILISIICILLVILLIVFLSLHTNDKKSKTEDLNQPKQPEISQEDQQLIDKYHQLNKNEKNVVNKILDSLNEPNKE